MACHLIVVCELWVTAGPMEPGDLAAHLGGRRYSQGVSPKWNPRGWAPLLGHFMYIPPNSTSWSRVYKTSSEFSWICLKVTHFAEKMVLLTLDLETTFVYLVCSLCKTWSWWWWNCYHRTSKSFWEWTDGRSTFNHSLTIHFLQDQIFIYTKYCPSYWDGRALKWKRGSMLHLCLFLCFCLLK